MGGAESDSIKTKKVKQDKQMSDMEKSYSFHLVIIPANTLLLLNVL